MPDKKLIDSDSLTLDHRVYYKYETTALTGPYTVVKVYRGHSGPEVQLKNDAGEVRRVTLADDDDYGALSFYAE